MIDEKAANTSYNNIPTIVFSSTLGWSTAYYLTEELTGRSPEWSCRLITGVHATLITFLSFLDWSYIEPWTIDTLGEPNSPYQKVVLCITLGYFVFDMIWVLIHQTEGIVMYCHHISSITALTFILLNATSGNEALLGISGLELTNPCLQTRWFLRTHGYQGTFLHFITELIFMITFVLFRILYGSYLVFSIINHSKPHRVIKWCTFLLYIVSWGFLLQMLSYIHKKYFKKEKHTSKHE